MALWSLQGEVWIMHCPLPSVFWLEDFGHINIQVFFHSSSSRKDWSLVFFFPAGNSGLDHWAQCGTDKTSETLCRQTKHHHKYRCLLAPQRRKPQSSGRSEGISFPFLRVDFSSTHALFLVLETLITSLENPAFLMAVEIT